MLKFVVQLPLSGYGGRSDLHIINMPASPLGESSYYHRIHDSAAQSGVISAVIENRGNHQAFVNVLAFEGVDRS